MKSNLVFRILAVLLALSGLYLAYQGWQASREVAITIEWSTASELDMAGFNVLRNELPFGDFEKINQDLIPPSDDPLTGGDYSFTDPDVKPGQRYFYKLEEVELNGNTNLHGPIEGLAKRGGTLEFVLAGLLLVGAVLALIVKEPQAASSEVPASLLEEEVRPSPGSGAKG